MKMLKTWKQTLLPVALALALIVPAAAYAAEQTDPGSGANGKNRTAQALPMPQGPGKGHNGFGMQFGKATFAGSIVNQQKYMELLAEKYAPDTLNNWKAAHTEQNSLQQQMQALMQDQGVQNALQAQREQLQKQWKEKQDELKKKVENGEITKEQLRSQMQAGALPFAAGNGSIPNALHNEVAQAARNAMQHRQALTEAVKADNADGIRSALASLLDDLKKRNEQAAAQIAKLKPNANGQTVQPKVQKQKAGAEQMKKMQQMQQMQQQKQQLMQKQQQMQKQLMQKQQQMQKRQQMQKQKQQQPQNTQSPNQPKTQ